MMANKRKGWWAVQACDYLKDNKVQRYGVIYKGDVKMGHIGPGEPVPSHSGERKSLDIALKICALMNTADLSGLPLTSL